MKLTKQTADTASYLAVETLGLDPDAVGLTSTEGVAVSLRRAASFMCPTSPGRLVDAVLGALRPLDGDDLRRDEVVELHDLLVSSGDLLELRHESGRSTRLLFLAPPSFIERVPGTYLLMGVRPFGAPLISDELAGAIEYEGHTRLLTLEPADYEKELRARGLQQVPKKRWIASPSVEAPADLIKQHRSRLNVAADAGELEGLQLLDPATKVRYYRGRWRTPAATDTGDFLARRPQAYGADLWCLVRCEAGVPMRILEFPVADPVVPGRDEAWRYQAAIDALSTLRYAKVVDIEAPDANVAIIVSGSGSVREHVQRLGRVLRKVGDKRAVLYELVTADTHETFTSERRREHSAYR